MTLESIPPTMVDATWNKIASSLQDVSDPSSDSNDSEASHASSKSASALSHSVDNDRCLTAYSDMRGTDNSDKTEEETNEEGYGSSSEEDDVSNASHGRYEGENMILLSAQESSDEHASEEIEKYPQATQRPSNIIDSDVDASASDDNTPDGKYSHFNLPYT